MKYKIQNREKRERERERERERPTEREREIERERKKEIEECVSTSKYMCIVYGEIHKKRKRDWKR